MLALSHADFLDEFYKVFGKVENIFSEEVSKFEEGVIKTARAAKAFYENHKTLILAGEVLLLAGTGLGEAGMLEEIVELYESGGVKCID